MQGAADAEATTGGTLHSVREHTAPESHSKGVVNGIARYNLRQKSEPLKVSKLTTIIKLSTKPKATIGIAVNNPSAVCTQTLQSAAAYLWL